MNGKAMIDGSVLRAMSADPRVFRQHLLVPTSRGVIPFGDDNLADFQVRDFRVLDESMAALAAGQVPRVRRIWIERTKGGSKDTDASIAMLWLLSFSTRPLRIQVGAYDSQQADEARLIVESILRCDGPLNNLLRQRVEVQRGTIRNRVSGSVVEILTTDSRGTHGARPDLVLCDELSHVGDEEFMQTLADNADKMPGSVVLIATNAGHVMSWQHNWRNIAASSDRWCFSTYTKPAPWIDLADLEESRLRNSAARFARLWAGEWVREGGDCLDLADIEASVDDELQPMQGHESGWSFVGGLDLSTRRDHSALVILGTHHRSKRIRLAWCCSWRPGLDGKVDLRLIRETALEVCRRFRVASLRYDPYQAELLSQDLRQANVRTEEVPFVGKNLSVMASTLIETFRGQQIDLFREEKLIRDLARLMIVERSFGYKLEAVRDAKDGHADLGFSLAIALPGAVAAIPHQSGEPWGGMIHDSGLRQPAWSTWG